MSRKHPNIARVAAGEACPRQCAAPVAPFTLEVALAMQTVASASTADLLEVLAGPDAARALDAAGGVRGLLDDPAAHDLDLMTRVRLGALQELIRRLLAERRRRGAAITGPADVARLVEGITLLDHEELRAVYLDARHRVLSIERLAIGSPAAVEVHPASAPVAPTHCPALRFVEMVAAATALLPTRWLALGRT